MMIPSLERETLKANRSTVNKDEETEMTLDCKTPTGLRHKIPETTWDCKTPTGEEHKIPILNTCPPAPGPRWLLDSLSEKKKASKMNSDAKPKKSSPGMKNKQGQTRYRVVCRLHPCHQMTNMVDLFVRDSAQ